jgi:hypothetical protein
MWMWDAPQGYHQFGVEEASQAKLAFAGPDATKLTYNGWLPKLVQMVWTAKSGPNLHQIWTKSGPHLNRFFKIGCQNSRQDTQPTYEGIITNNRCKQKGVQDTIEQLHSSTTNKMSCATLPQATFPSLSPWVEQRHHQIMALPLPNFIRRPLAVRCALAVVGLLAWGGGNERHQK